MRKPVRIYIFNILRMYTASVTRAMFVDLMEKNKRVRIYICSCTYCTHINIIIYGNENENVHMGWSCK